MMKAIKNFFYNVMFNVLMGDNSAGIWICLTFYSLNDSGVCSRFSQNKEGMDV